MTDDRPVWVLGGGGVAGIAWETGILAGLADEGVVIAPDSVVIGTSAGAVVGAQVTSGTSLEELYAVQVANDPREVSPNLSAGSLLKLATAGKRIGRLALDAKIDDPGRHLRIIADRLPVHDWPAIDLRLTAFDAESGEFRVFTRDDGVALVDAVAASSAIPLSMAPVQIQGRHYIDGGMRSAINADLAPGAGPVVVLAPSTASFGSGVSFEKQRAALGGRRVTVIERDAPSKAAQGRKLMDRSVVPAVVAAGRAQGRAEAARVRVALAGQ
ncbi:patatin-like phospholipase family protein [Salinibacterium soli]|uniref:Patatin-like phospholipase family protein n=1 Tax=Antiquaquibacter soli TaxID=3064523 RepID=A0ABT9BNX2_9MICO|nr:patatin-like phospholipase family protein [Protaetiibacter sp. WY-16]MDO7882737.1 patatin-like phospholipase family protein [Protaetiibacter sp. WY-16]